MSRLSSVDLFTCLHTYVNITSYYTYMLLYCWFCCCFFHRNIWINIILYFNYFLLWMFLSMLSLSKGGLFSKWAFLVRMITYIFSFSFDIIGLQKQEKKKKDKPSPKSKKKSGSKTGISILLFLWQFLFYWTETWHLRTVIKSELTLSNFLCSSSKHF